MIKYEKPEQIELFGGGRTMWEFYSWLKARGYIVHAYTSPRQVTTETPPEAQVIESWKTWVTAYAKKGVLGICFGPAWDIPEPSRWDGRLLDFMSIPYPSFLGGAHETWAELIGQKTWGCCLQLVTENTRQGKCHDGDVIMADSFEYEKRYEFYLSLLMKFILHVEDGHTFGAIGSQHPRYVFPRLNTGANGWIDWSWSTSEIWRFINAFAPYGGAGTYNGTEEVRIKGAGQWSGAPMHPYCAGLVLDVSSTGARIACRDGILLVTCNGTLKPGDRLHTDREKLEEALLYRPEYDAKGDAKATQEPVSETRGTHFLQVDPISIRLLKPDDVTQVYVDWLNDPEVNRYLEVRHKKWTRANVTEWVRENQDHDGDRALFGIYLHDRHIGNIKIGPENPYHHYADLSYFIGEKELWGKGYATKAVKLAIGWAWEQMKLHRLQAGIYESNAASQALLLKCGFTWDGDMRKQLLLEGKWEEHMWYSIINPDWKETA